MSLNQPIPRDLLRKRHFPAVAAPHFVRLPLLLLLHTRPIAACPISVPILDHLGPMLHISARLLQIPDDLGIPLSHKSVNEIFQDVAAEGESGNTSPGLDVDCLDVSHAEELWCRWWIGILVTLR